MVIVRKECVKVMHAGGKRACFQFPECSLPYAKVMPTNGKRACFQFPECSLPYAKVMQVMCRTK